MDELGVDDQLEVQPVELYVVDPDRESGGEEQDDDDDDDDDLDIEDAEDERALDQLVELASEEYRRSVQQARRIVAVEFDPKRARVENAAVNYLFETRFPRRRFDAGEALRLVRLEADDTLAKIEAHRDIGSPVDRDLEERHEKSARIVARMRRVDVAFLRRFNELSRIKSAQHADLLDMLRDVRSGRSAINRGAFDLLRANYNDPTFTSCSYGTFKDFYRRDVGRYDPEYLQPDATVFGAWARAIANSRHIVSVRVKVDPHFSDQIFARDHAAYFEAVEDRRERAERRRELLPQLREQRAEITEHIAQLREDYVQLSEHLTEQLARLEAANPEISALVAINIELALEHADDNNVRRIVGQLSASVNDTVAHIGLLEQEYLTVSREIRELSTYLPEPLYPSKAFERIFLPLVDAIERSTVLESLTIDGAEALGGAIFASSVADEPVAMSVAVADTSHRATQRFLGALASSTRLADLTLGRADQTIADFVSPIVGAITHVRALNVNSSPHYVRDGVDMASPRFDAILSAIAKPDSRLQSLDTDLIYDPAAFDELCDVLRDENSQLRQLKISFKGTAVRADIIPRLLEAVRGHPALTVAAVHLVFYNQPEPVSVPDDFAPRVLAAVAANPRLVHVDIFAADVSREPRVVAAVESLARGELRRLAAARFAPHVVPSLQQIAYRAYTQDVASRAASTSLETAQESVGASVGDFVVWRARELEREHKMLTEMYDLVFSSDDESVLLSSSDYDIVEHDTDSNDDYDYGYGDEQLLDMPPGEDADESDENIAPGGNSLSLLYQEARFSDEDDALRMQIRAGKIDDSATDSGDEDDDDYDEFRVGRARIDSDDDNE